jgi:hypothetical protein
LTVTALPRTASALLVTLLALAPLSLTERGATAASPPLAARVSEEATLDITVTELSPRAPAAADQPVRIAGTVTNRGEEPVEDVELRVLVDRVLTSRSALARADEDRRTGRPRGEPVALAEPVLTPGESAPFELALTVGDLRLGRIGSYPLAVQARGRPEDSRQRRSLGLATTFLPWFPDGPPQRTRVAWLWPLVDHPRLTPRGLLLDDDLARSLSTDGKDSGRLGRLLASTRAAPHVPVTYAVDPDLLSTVAVMTEPYLVRRASGEPEEKPPSPAALGWLDALTTALADPPDTAARAPRGLLSLPYADPDIVALARTPSGLAEDVELLRRVGEDVTAEITGREPDRTIAWPPDGRLTPAALDLALAGDTRAVVLDEDALDPVPFDTSVTPSAPVELASASAGALTGLVVERELSRLLEVGPEDEGWQGARLAEQRFIAETAMIAAESPANARTLVVAPDRRGDVVPAVATAALQASTRLPWLCAVELAAVAAGTAVCPEPVEGEQPDELADRGALQTPEPDAPLLSAGYLAELAVIRALAEQLTDQVLLPGSDEAVATKRRLLVARGRSESSAWRERPRTGLLLTELLADDVEALREQVSLRTSGRVALSGSTGTITVSVVNALEQPVTVGVDLNDPVEARLESTSTEVREVPASASLQVPIEVTTRTSGQFVVRAQLLDRSGTPFGQPVELIVRSTGYSRAALAVTGIGAAVLLVAAGVRIMRRAMRRTPGETG